MTCIRGSSPEAEYPIQIISESAQSRAIVGDLPIGSAACFVVVSVNVIGMSDMTAVEICIDVESVLRSGCEQGTSLDDSKPVYECARCALGRFSAQAGGICHQCPRSETATKQDFTYTPYTGASACSRCESGSFSPSYGASTCTQCAEGYFSPSDGASACAQCLDAGTYTPTPGATVCSVCEEGKHSVRKSNVTPSVCNRCPKSPRVACQSGHLTFFEKTWYDVRLERYDINENTEVHKCFNDEACMLDDSKSRVECNVDQGYFGPLCGACDRGKNFIRSGFGCEICWDMASSYLGSVALVIIFVIAVVYITTEVSFDRLPGDYSSVVNKILISHLQMLGVLGIFKAKGTAIFNEVVNRPAEIVGGSFTSVLPIKCALGSQVYGAFNMSC